MGASTSTSLPAGAPADPRFVQRDRREILAAIKRLAKEETPVLLVHGGEGEVIHTRVLDLTDDGRSLFLEWGPDDTVSQAVLDAGTVSCQAELDNVRLHFALEPTLARVQYLKAFGARVPDLMMRVQRREYYRLAIEPADGVGCTVDLPLPHQGPRATEVTLVDLSGGGMSFRVPLTQASQLRLHAELGGCTLTLADAGALETRLRIRNMRRLVGPDEAPWVRVGCQFLDLRVGHIAQVQRFIGHIERRRRAEERRQAELEARRAEAQRRR